MWNTKMYNIKTQKLLSAWEKLLVGSGESMLGLLFFFINQDYKATIFLRQMWVDPRLQFTEYNTSVSLTPSFLKKLWVPDTFIINEKAANFHQITTDNKLLRLKPNGELLYSARWRVVNHCIFKPETRRRHSTDRKISWCPKLVLHQIINKTIFDCNIPI